MAALTDGQSVLAQVAIGLLLGLVLTLALRALRSTASRPLPGERLMLVTAHPDDEAMFFAPMLFANRAVSGSAMKQRVNVMCLSTGDADGLGRMRRKELVAACAVLGVKKEGVHVYDDAKLRDGMDTHWDEAYIAKLVKSEVTKYKIDTIITFDAHGVSGHANHRAIARAIAGMVLEQQLPSTRVFALESVGFVRKFLGVLDGFFSSYSEWFFVTPPGGIADTWTAMSKHKSQFVLFRKAFLIFSRFTYVNTLVELS